MVALALSSALVLGTPSVAAVEHPASAEPSTVADTVTLDPAKEIHISSTDLWKDATAIPGDVVRIPFLGTRNYSGLSVNVSEPFQDFQVFIEADNSIVVAVPHHLDGATKVAPVFTVSDKSGELDTFSITVRPDSEPRTAVENHSALFKIISEIASRMPHFPFVAQLLKF